MFKPTALISLAIAGVSAKSFTEKQFEAFTNDGSSSTAFNKEVAKVAESHNEGL